MSIEQVNRSSELYNRSVSEVKQKQTEQQAAQSAEGARKQDRLELSSEAQKANPIQMRIEQGYYDKPEIIRETASRINKEV
ncbi:MAG: hypothetical protein ACLFR2_12195 [Candidatus Kapaibacterium sp.]